MPSAWRSLRLLAFLLLLPTSAFAQRELHWDALDVEAHLNADGRLQVVETQTMVFTGDWNGGERTFNIRPRQALTFEGMSRWNGTAWQQMTEDSSLDDVNDYAFTDTRTLRWRSRRTSDPGFERTSIRYALRYTLTGILQQDGERYVVNHDFAFPDRVGSIANVQVHLTLDPVWQPLNPLRDVYTASALSPGRSFVVTVPLRYVGAGGAPDLAWQRPAGIKIGVFALLGLALAAAGLMFAQENAAGRFAPLAQEQVDASWLREHILKYPAELVSAAWDDSIGRAEVVALLARLTTEGKLTSRVTDDGMTLHLVGSKIKLKGYEKTLIDKLFYGGRTTTSTEDIKSHYKAKGFDPVSVIKTELQAAVKTTFPFAAAPYRFRALTAILFLAGLLLLLIDCLFGSLNGLAVFLLVFGSLLLTGLASLPGLAFRKRMDWGYQQAALCLIPAAVIAGGTAAFLWLYPGTGRIDLSNLGVAGIVALALGAAATAINALRSRQQCEGIAFRKTLAAGRHYFITELQKAQPSLRDEWYPWLLAFELDKQMDDWSVARAAVPGMADDGFRRSRDSTVSSSSSSSPSDSSSSWTGFGGGRSGGAGAGASWAAAASGFSASVAAPSSSSSDSGSSGGGSSSGGSSGGGGGGGW